MKNRLSGGLPKDLCYKLLLLEELWLAENQLSGQIPTSLCKCRKLHVISLSYNNFTGELPGDIGNLLMLMELQIAKSSI